MINRVFKHGHNITAAVNYAFSSHDHLGNNRGVKPELLMGDAAGIQAVTRTLVSKNRYTAGVLAFAETNIGRQQLKRIADEHLEISFPGIDPAEIAHLYVIHRDKSITEIHYWFANLHLGSGKRITGYVHSRDCSRLRNWVQTVNDRYLFRDPNDPKNSRLIVPAPSRAPAERKQIANALTASCLQLAVNRDLRCRSDLLQKLSDAGWSISRQSKTSISVTHPKLKMPIRLRGKIFHSNWSGIGPRTEVASLSRAFQRDRRDRLARIYKRLKGQIQALASYNQRRYSTDFPYDERALASIQEHVRAHDARERLHIGRNYYGALLQSLEDLQPTHSFSPRG